MTAVAVFEPGIDVIVIDYRTPQDLSDFLESYYNNLPLVPSTLHVGLVQPTPLDERVAQRTEHGDFVYGFDDNVGYARSVNAIAAKATREVLAIFNADCVLEEGVLQGCYDALMSNPSWGVLGPRQVDKENRLTHGGVFGTNEAPTNPRWLQHDGGQFSEIDENVVTVSGAAFFVRHEVWRFLTDCPLYVQASGKAEGAFLPTPHFFEETFCALHARFHGWKAVYYGPLKMIHKWGGATPSPGWAEQRMIESRETFRIACDHHGIARH